MNIFTNTRREYGQNTVRKIREIELEEKKIARHRNIKTQIARDIIKKAEKDLIREIILINNNLGGLQDRKEELVREINKQLPSNVSKHVFSHLTKVRER